MAFVADNTNKQPRDHDVVVNYSKDEFYEKVKEMGGEIEERGKGSNKSYIVLFEGAKIDATIPPGDATMPFRERLKLDVKQRDVRLLPYIMTLLQKKKRSSLISWVEKKI